MKLVVIAALVIAQVPLLLWSDNTSENLLKLPCLSQVVVVTWPSLNPTKVGGSEILAEFERSKNSNYVPRINSNDLKSFVEEKCGSVIEIELQQQTSLDQDQELKQKLRSLNLQDYIIMLTGSVESSTLEKRAVNFTIPYSKRPIVNRYEFVSVPILMGALVTLLLLVISCVGVNALMNLQTPTKFETPVYKK